VLFALIRTSLAVKKLEAGLYLIQAGFSVFRGKLGVNSAFKAKVQTQFSRREVKRFF
jgi:hypothetical protein